MTTPSCFRIIDFSAGPSSKLQIRWNILFPTSLGPSLGSRLWWSLTSSPHPEVEIYLASGSFQDAVGGHTTRQQAVDLDVDLELNLI